MAIKPIDFYKQLTSNGIEFFTGVPDSLLKEFCFCIDNNTPVGKHIIAANEGNAVALAAGYYLATKSIPLVYMQNSGFGNAINPLLSLCDSDVYSIPMLLIVGWRGEPGVKDEPQHLKQGKVQLNMLNSLGMPYEIISKQDPEFQKKISKSIEIALSQNQPFVLLIKKGTFEKFKNDHYPSNSGIGREEALEIILSNIDSNAIIVSTTGKTSREIFEIREKRNQSHEQDFLTVGSMGHCSSIALGIALARPDQKVFCIDGDGAMLMHMGNLTSISALKPKNFYHILMNNEVHESVGGQSTAAKDIDLSAIIKSMGVSKVFRVKEISELEKILFDFTNSIGPSFIEIKIKAGSRDDLGRPTIEPVDNKNNFMNFLKK
tara:strand:- start:31760 stop:32887 length:1128 start_codon:yes stop_codon:yes gene_type:complete